MDSDKSSLTPVTPDYACEGPCFADPLVETRQAPQRTPAEPIIDKESLMKKLESIPAETLRSILTNQVDLEIRLKHKELKLTEEEIGKCEAQMLALRKFFEVPNDITFRTEPNDFTLKYYDILNKSLSVSYTNLQQQRYAVDHPVSGAAVEPVAHSYRTRSTTLSLRPSVAGSTVRVAGCLYRRTDGIIVKLTCPDCQRSNFSSAQGFLNHSRIAHSKEYTSQDAAALSCGEILGDEIQDEEGLASLNSLKQKNMEPSKNLNVNEIYFNGLSRSLNTVHRALQDGAGGGPAKQTKNKSESLSPGAEARPRKTPPAGDLDSNELMKKVIKSGVAHDATEYMAMVAELRSAVPNAHLFDDEEEEPAKDGDDVRADSPRGASDGAGLDSRAHVQSASDRPADSGHAETGGKYENRLRRRKSRGGVGVEVPRLRGRDDDDKRSKRRKSQR